MSEVFLAVVNMSIAAGWIVLAVVLLRAVFRRAPKWIAVLLWGIVALRLLCPFTVESALSLIPSAETIPPDVMTETTPHIDAGIAVIDRTVNPALAGSLSPAPGDSANPRRAAVMGANFDPKNPIGATASVGRSAVVILEEEPEDRA